ncbi:MAG: hypothetical protein QNJ00_06405 [Woeseiaceae bacterium]|nr:hypothetical protein [Woeseiaceae bacterium]
MSIDWQLCVTHEQPPHFTADEVNRILRCLEQLGLLENLKFECHKGEDYDPDDVETLADTDAVIEWLGTTTDDRFWLGCRTEFGVLGDREECDRRHPVLSRLLDELMDASAHAVLSGGSSPAYPPQISALGIAFNLEGSNDTDKLLEYLHEQPTFSAMMSSLAEALGRPFRACALEHIGYLRVRPDDEVLGLIREDMSGDWAERMPDAWGLVEPLLTSPARGDIVEASGNTRNYWIVSDIVTCGTKEWLIAYDNTPECWVFERTAGQDAWKYAYYRNSFYGVLDLIQYEAAKQAG